MRCVIDIVGQRFGMLLVLKREPSAGANRQARWLCACDCGRSHVASSETLRHGKARSCGCARGALISQAKVKHGHAFAGRPSAEYRVWKSMRARCNNANNPAYNDYGGRGIFVCTEWDESFQTFLADMGERPSLAHTLDRIDNDGPYSPSNCKWTTKKEQARNRRSSRLIEWRGEKKTLVEWSDVLGIHQGTLNTRLSSGWGIERAFSEPLRQAKRAAKMAAELDGRQERAAA